MSTRAHLRVRETSGPGNGAMQAALLFRLGRVCATNGAIHALTSAAAHPIEYVARHLAGDWGDLDPEDRAANDRALRLGERLISAYQLANGEKIWIITEADRSATTILLPAEY